jgi:translation elongation factor EF-Ts
LLKQPFKSESKCKQLLESDKNLSDKVVDVMGKVGEKIEVSRVLTEKAEMV